MSKTKSSSGDGRMRCSACDMELTPETAFPHPRKKSKFFCQDCLEKDQKFFDLWNSSPDYPVS